MWNERSNDSGELLPFVALMLAILFFWFLKVYGTHKAGKRISTGDTIVGFLISGGFFCLLVAELLRNGSGF